MNLTAYLYLPDLPEGAFPNAVSREMFEAAMKANLDPLPLPATGRTRASVYLGAKLSALLEKAVLKSGLPSPEAFAAYAAAGWKQKRDSGGDARDDWGGQRETIQAGLLRTALQAGKEDKIAIIEAGTGVGKSRVMCRTAIERLKVAPDGLIGIFAPTVSVLSHLCQEWQKCNPPEATERRIVLGRRQFVDEERLRIYLCNPEIQDTLGDERKHALIWLENGCPVVSDAGKSLAQMAPRLSHLADDFREIAPSIPVDEVLLQPSDEGRAAKVYDGLRAEAFRAGRGVLFCTHAMFFANAVAMRRNPEGIPILPDFAMGIFDEAHLLENGLIQQIGGDCHLNMLRLLLKETDSWKKMRLGTVSEEALAVVSEAISGLQSLFLCIDKPRGFGNRYDCSEVVVKLLRPVANALNKFKRGNSEGAEIKRILEFASTVERVIGGREHVDLTFSPIRKMPCVTVGPRSVKKWFEAIWEGFPSAALFSATLFLETGGGEYSARYMQTVKLAIPDERVIAPEPVQPEWLTAPVTLLVPKAQDWEDYVFPGERSDEEADQAAYNRWLDVIARCTLRAAKTAPGGTLVLCCSYEDIAGLQVRLESIAPRIFSQSRWTGVQTIKPQFVSAALSGQKPVWLATGAAWTGLDLKGPQENPAEDFVLTDVVVPRIPFGQTRSSTHIVRAVMMGFDAELMEAAFQLRQGLGRLIRRPGVVNRRLWFLDGRVHGPKRRYYGRINALLKRYKNRTPIVC